MKKWFIMILMLLTLTGCGDTDKPSNDKDGLSVKPIEVKEISINCL